MRLADRAFTGYRSACPISTSTRLAPTSLSYSTLFSIGPASGSSSSIPGRTAHYASSGHQQRPWKRMAKPSARRHFCCSLSCRVRPDCFGSSGRPSRIRSATAKGSWVGASFSLILAATAQAASDTPIPTTSARSARVPLLAMRKEPTAPLRQPGTGRRFGPHPPRSTDTSAGARLASLIAGLSCLPRTQPSWLGSSRRMPGEGRSP